MADQPRVAKVLGALLGSMTVGAVILLALDGRPVPAGGFSLASYTQLDSISQVVSSGVSRQRGSWNRIEIFYSRTTGGNLSQVAQLKKLPSVEDLNFHFLVCNGRGAGDGSVQGTEKWKKQWPCIAGDKWYGDSFTIRVCVAGDSVVAPATDSQRQRVGDLIEGLCHRYDITPDNVKFPPGWEQ